MDRVRDFVLETLQREYSFKQGVDPDGINYVADGYMDSLGLLQFIVELEDEFNIEFTEDELNSADFKNVGTLIRMIENKMG